MPTIIGATFIMSQGCALPLRGVVIAAEGDPITDPESAILRVRFLHEGDSPNDENGIRFVDIINMGNAWRWTSIPEGDLDTYTLTIPCAVHEKNGWASWHGRDLVVSVAAHNHDEAVAIVGGWLSREIAKQFPLNAPAESSQGTVSWLRLPAGPEED